jgi:hypothetical protein
MGILLFEWSKIKNITEMIIRAMETGMATKIRTKAIKEKVMGMARIKVVLCWKRACNFMI